MQVTMLLCDWAEAVDGKLYAQGGGWTHVLVDQPEQPLSMAVGLVVAIPWGEANRRHPWELWLESDEGQPVVVNGQEVKAENALEVGRPPGVKPGSDLSAVLAFKFLGLPLAPGGYVWKLTIGGDLAGRTPFWVVRQDGR